MYQMREMGAGRGWSADLENWSWEARRVGREPGRVASSMGYALAGGWFCSGDFEPAWSGWKVAVAEGSWPALWLWMGTFGDSGRAVGALG